MLHERKAFAGAVPVEGGDRQPNRARVRRGPADHLRDALVALSGDHAIVANHTEKAWASITFDGSRHILELLFEGPAATLAGEELIALLPEHEFAIPGQIVASADVTGVNHRLAPEPNMLVTAEILLLKDA